jgi:hypothetical protein
LVWVAIPHRVSICLRLEGLVGRGRLFVDAKRLSLLKSTTLLLHRVLLDLVQTVLEVLLLISKHVIWLVMAVAIGIQEEWIIRVRHQVKVGWPLYFPDLVLHPLHFIQ